MLEVFSRDRELDFEFFVFTNGEIKYKTRDCYEMSKELKDKLMKEAKEKGLSMSSYIRMILIKRER